MLYIWTTVVKALTYLRGPSKKIQGESLDLYDVVGQIKVVQGDLQHERENAEQSFFKRCYNCACSMAKLVGIVPSMPRLAQSPNAPKLTHQKITTEGMFVCHFLTTLFKELTVALIRLSFS